MFRPGIHKAALAAMLASVITAVQAEQFALPAEGPVAFRRDQLPISPDTMARLSRNLVTLADGVDGETPRKRRTAAQLLALSIALDPGNVKARRLIRDFQTDSHHADGDESATGTSRKELERLLPWLESPDAGAQGKALAACLKDVLAATTNNGDAPAEEGAWSGWIPPLASYEPSKVVTPDPDPADKPQATVVMLKKARVWAPMWVKSDPAEGAPWTLENQPIDMTAATSEVPEGGQATPLHVSIGPPDATTFKETNDLIRGILKAHFPQLPGQTTITIAGKTFNAQSRNTRRSSTNGAAAALAMAALNGREPEATIIGDVDPAGTFILPQGFWDRIRALEAGTGGRLVVPQQAADILPALLAFEKPGFFFKYEVLLAKNIDEVVEYAAKDPGPEIAGSVTKFHDIHEKLAGQQPGLFVANSFVKRRLIELGQEAPYHFSARMLAIQGSGNRPILVPRQVLAAETRRAIEPMSWIIKWNGTEVNSEVVKRLNSTFKTCDASLQGLRRYSNKEDLPMLEKTIEMVALIRPLERAARGGRGEAQEIAATLLAAHRAIIALHRTIAEKLDEAANDVPVLPSPAPAPSTPPAPASPGDRPPD